MDNKNCIRLPIACELLQDNPNLAKSLFPNLICNSELEKLRYSEQISKLIDIYHHPLADNNINYFLNKLTAKHKLLKAMDLNGTLWI